MADKKTKTTKKKASKKETKNTNKTKKSKKSENIENVEKNDASQKKINENFIALMVFCVSVVCTVIISLPSVGFFGKIIRSIILGLFSSFSYFIFLSAISLAVYKIINYKKFRLEDIKKIDATIFMLMFMFIFVGFNMGFMKENSSFSFSVLSNIAISGTEYKGTGIIPYLLSFIFFKLIGIVGILLFILISLSYLLIKYKREEMTSIFYNLVDKIGDVGNKEEKKYEHKEQREQKEIEDADDVVLDIPRFADDLIEEHLSDIPNLDDIDIFPKKTTIKYDDETDFERYPDINITDANSKNLLRFDDSIGKDDYCKNYEVNEYGQDEVTFNEKIEMLYEKYKRDFGYTHAKNSYRTSDQLSKNVDAEKIQEKITLDENKVTIKSGFDEELKDDFEELKNDIGLEENTESDDIKTENILQDELTKQKYVDDIEKFKDNNEKEINKSKENTEEYYNEEYAEEKEQFDNDKEVIEEIVEKRPYVYPTVDLLNEYKQVATYDRAEKIRKAQLLKQTLASFGVEANVENIAVGPTITRYEVKPKVGTKVSKITNLTEDLALALAAKAIRIEAPIPGKSYIGVEIPNETSQTVSFKEVIQTCIEKRDNYNIVFAMGKDISGEVILSDITKMPHALIAGSTGSGKSVCINTIICSILYNYSPEEVKLILVDPKVVELSIYNKMPHLIIPVVTDMRKTPQALNWAVNEMERRYALFADNKSKDINSYNQKNEEKLPRIVIIIDELADLMMVAPKDIEEAICRLAQKARACGIHLIVATQRPSVDVITGLIKANIPSRIAFAVSSNTDSRTILDTGGADKLLGKGDMLYSPIGMNKPMRIQGAFMTEEEVEKVTDFIEQNNFIVNLEKMQEEVSKQIDEIVVASDSKKNSGNSDDDLYDKVVEFAYENEEISVSLVQRQFRIGYNRASRIVEDMEKNGIVGKSDGSRPRKVIRNQE